MQLGNSTQFDATPKFSPQKSCSVVKAFARRFNLCGFTEERKKHLGMTIIGSHFDIRKSHHTDAGILDLEADKVCKFALHLLSHTQGA